MNPFDQFDSTPGDGQASANPFDQFDGSDAKPSKQNKGLAGDLGTDLKRGIMGIPGAVTGLVDIPVAAVTGEAAIGKGWDRIGKATGFQPSKWAKEAEAEYSPARQEANRLKEAAWEDGTAMDIAGAYLKNPGHNILGPIVESAPSMVVGGVAARGLATASKIAPIIAGGIGEGAVMAGQAMNNLTGQGVDARTAAGYSAATGIAGGALGAAGGKFAQKLGVIDPDTAMAGGAARAVSGATGMAALKETGKRMIGGGISEGVFEELPQSVMEQGFSNLAQGNPVTEGMARAGVEGTLAGFGMGAAFNSLPGSKYIESKRTPPAEDKPEIAGLLPSPTMAGTPSEQILQGEVDRQNAVDTAQANADQLYAERAAYEEAMQSLYPSGPPTLTTDPEPLQQRIDAMLGIDANALKGLRKVQYQKQLESAFAEVVGITHDANGLEIPLTMGAMLDSQAIAEAEGRRVVATRNAEQQAGARAQQLADEETPSIPVVGPLSSIANAAVKSGVSAHVQMQRAAAEQAKDKPAGPLSEIAAQSEQSNGPIATQAASQVATPGAQVAGGNVPGSAGVQSSALAGDQGRGGNSAEMAAPGMRPAVSAGIAGDQAAALDQITGGQSDAPQHEQTQTQAVQTNDAQAGPAPVAAPAASQGQGTGAAGSTQAIDLSSRADAQLNFLSQRGINGNKEAAIAEIARRAAASGSNEQQAEAGLPASAAGESSPAPVANTIKRRIVGNAANYRRLDALLAATDYVAASSGGVKFAGQSKAMWLQNAEYSAESSFGAGDKIRAIKDKYAVTRRQDLTGFDGGDSVFGVPLEKRSYRIGDNVPGVGKIVDEVRLDDGFKQFMIGGQWYHELSVDPKAKADSNQEPINKVNAPGDALSQPKTDAAPEAKQANAPASKTKPRNKIDPEKDSLFVAIAKAGGMDTDELLSNGIDSNDITLESATRVKKDGQLSKKRRMPISFGFALPLHKKGGMSFDAMREAMQQYGYMSADATKNDAIDLFNQELGGNPVYTARAIEIQQEQDQEAFDKHMQEEQDRIDAELAAQEIVEDESGFYELSDEEQSLANDFAELAFGENGKQDENATRIGMRALGFTEEEINDELAKNSSAQRESEEITGGSSQESGAGRDGNRAEDAQAHERDGQEGFGLAGQTNDQAAEQFAQQQAGEPAEPTKEQADRERDAVPFSMQMQSQPKPQGRQVGLFTADGRVSVETKAAEQSPAASESLKNEMAGFAGVSDAEYELRKLSRKEKRDGDVELGNGKFITLEQAVAAAKKNMAPADWSKPFQFNRALDIAPIDWNTMVDAMKSAAVDAKKQEESKPAEDGKPANKAEAIGDFGEKLGGAKKDRMPSMDVVLSDDDIATQPFSKIWPASEIDAIEDPFIAAVAHAARAEVPAKPRVAYKVDRWVEKVKTVRSLAQRILDGSVSKDRFSALMGSMRGLDGFAAKVALLESIDRKHWSRIGDVREYPDAYRYGDNGEKISSPSVLIDLDGKHKRFDGAKSVADMVESLNESLGDGAPGKKMQFEVRGRGASFAINKKGDKEYRKLKTFSNTKDAFAFIKDNYDDLVAAWEGVKESDNVKKSDVRGEDNRPRTGSDWRKGKDVTPEQFAETFGFRGVEFGNWVSQGKNDKERQGMLNQAFDAMMDLADIVGIPPKAISLNGSLGLGFGSRGGGWASAHFEPGNLVINLTKTRGAGAIAHEWFHALDNYFARQRGGEVKMERGIGAQQAYRTNNFITYRPEPMYVHKTQRSTPVTRARLQQLHDGNPNAGYYKLENWQIDPSHPQGVRPEVERTFADLVETLDESPMLARAKKNDKEADGYWSRIIERSARSFENFVISKMMEKGYSNDYLANVRPVEDFPRSKERYPYLLPEEVAPIAEAFDTLFGTLKTKETDSGVMLYNQASLGKISPADKAIYGMAAEGKSAGEILKFVASASRNPFYRQLAKLLLKTSIAPSITVGDGKNWKFNAGEGNKYAAGYNPKSDTISLFRPASAERNMLHELTHAATLKALSGKGMAAAQMKALYQHVKKSGKLKGMYGMSDVDEFIAEAFSNPKFQQRLKAVAAPARSNGALSSAWDWFVRIVRGILGVQANEENALAQALEIGVDVMRENMKAGEAGGGTRYNIVGDHWDVSEPSKMDDVIYALQDKHIDTKRVMQAIMGTGKKVKDEINAYLQEELFHGRAAKGVKDFLDFELRPLLKQMQEAKVDMGDFEEYLWNRHAEERNKQIAKINPEMPDGGSGIETAAARAYLAVLGAEQKRVFESMAAKVEAINKNSQRVLVESGLEKQSTIDAWNGAYQHYVPLQREDVDNGHVGTGKGFSVRGSSTKRAMGSGKAVVDIIANLTMQRERNIVRAEKNRVSNALMGLALDNQNPDFWTVDKAPKERVVEETAIYTVLDADGKKIDEFTRMADAERLANKTEGATIDQSWGDRVTERVTPGFKNRDNVLLTRVNGEDHYIIFNERDERAMRMATAMKNLDVDNLGRVLSIVGKATRYLSSINTQYNPVFGVINLIRDAQGALINLSSTPLAGDQKRVLGYTKDALIGIYRDIRAHRAGKVPSSNWASLFEEFQKEGGQTGYRDQYANAEARAEAIQSELSQFKEGKAKQLTRGLFGWLSDYNETMENAVRLAAYKAAKEKGMSKQQAASLAKNITVNFNRKGQMATQVGALYAFFNASVQGTARIAETLFDMKGGDIRTARLSKAGKKIVYGGIMLGSMQALLLAAAGFDDDEPPEFVRERNLILPIGDGKYLTLAMPLGFHVLPGMGRIATEFVMSGGKDPIKKLAAFGSMFAESFNPVGSSGWSLQTITPSVVDPLAALAENRDFTGKPIYQEDFNKMNPTPGHTRAKDTASIWSKAISEGMNFMTGGTDYKPGLFSPTPDQIDYLIGQATGGVGREVSKVSQTASATATGEELPLYKVPLVGRFVGDTGGKAGESAKFYDHLREINMHEAEYKGLIKDGKRQEAAEYLAENPGVKFIMFGNTTERAVKKLREAKRGMIERGESPEKVADMDARIAAAMKQFNERVGAAL